MYFKKKTILEILHTSFNIYTYMYVGWCKAFSAQCKFFYPTFLEASLQPQDLVSASIHPAEVSSSKVLKPFQLQGKSRAFFSFYYLSNAQCFVEFGS